MKQNCYNFMKQMSSFLVLCLILTTSIVRGQTIYTGPNNGDWLTAANWSNGLPAIGNEPTIVGSTIVCINGTVSLNYAVTNFGLIINKGTTTLSGSINSGGALANQGTFTINAGATMTSSGGFNNSGTLNNSGNVNSNSPLTNTTTGVFNNFAVWSQNGVAVNDGIMSNKAGTFSCPAALTNNKTAENLAGATWKIDFGGSFTNATGSTLSNAGQFQNLGSFTNTTTVTNSGTFTNNGIHTCSGIFNNESGGTLSSSATVNLSGRINNKLGATITSSFRFNILANGYVSNMAQFTNANMIDVALGGTYCNETSSILTGQYGSAITNAGYFKIAASSTVTTNGSITNARKFDVYGTYDAMGGGQIINSDSLCNYGLVKNVNVINNSGVWKNFGTTENNSGGVWTNTNKIENNKGAVISNNYEIYNKPAATIVNNGTFNNGIRIFNEGTITNNAYFVTTGDFLNKVGGSLVNTEVFVVREGSIQNEGSVLNQKTMINETCSIITNKAGATINNTGRFENKGIIFQRGTVTGTAILALGGYTQGAGSAAPTLCLTSLTTGTDAHGEAKVYGQSGFKTGIGIDECAGFQYFANDVNRLIYTCPQIGQTLNTRFKILTRTGDSLTCTVPTTVFDNVAPVVSNCPTDATIYTTQNTATYTWANVTGIDNCGDTPSVTSTNASGSAFPLGLTQVTVSVKDSRNNTSDCIFKVNVVKITTTATCPANDVAAPVFANCPTNQTINSNSNSAVVVWNTPSVTDNCYPVVVQQNLNSGIAFPTGTNTVVYTAKDPSGNVGTCSFTVTVNSPADICTTDPLKPVIVNCPANFFGIVNTAINGAVGYWSTPTATDNCGAVTLSGSAVSGSIFNVGTTNVVYTATDAKNNTSTCSFTVNIAGTNPCAGDVTGPVLTCPANVSVSTTNPTATATWATPTATDACAPVVLNGSHQSGNTFALGTTTVTYSASDKIGNTSKCTFTVSLTNPCLNDTQAPTLTACPASQTIPSSNGINATATWTAPTATDNCTLSGVTSNYASGATFNVGTTNVVYTATDTKGNSLTCSFSITVNANTCATDATPPTFANCPSNISVTTSNICQAATWTAPTATDNCGTPSVTSTYNSGFCFPIGTTTVAYTATDAQGNKATCSFTVTVTNPCASLTNSAVTEYYVDGTWYTGSSVTVQEGTSLTLSANPNGLPSYKWTGPNGFSKTGNSGGDVLVSSSITTAQAGTYTVVIKDANNCTATKTIVVSVAPSFSITNCGGNGEQLILKGSIDYLSIGNTMSKSEDRSNCGKNSSSASTLSLPAGATVKAAYLYWSGSGSLDNKVTLNGKTIRANGTKTFYEPAWKMTFFGARADVTSCVTGSGLYTVSGLTWDNTGNYCTSNAAYGAWSMVVVYEKAGLIYSTVHINTDNFRMTYPSNTYNSTINCVNVPSGCSSNAKLTIIAFEGDNYKGEYLNIGGVYRGDNNFRGQSGPNLDILTFDVANVVKTGTTSLSYNIQSYLSYTIWGNAIEGLFDYVKVLKYNSCSPTTNLAVASTLLDVNAKAETNKARIEWVNNSGYKNDYFAIEKMNNATGEFEKLGIQNSMNTDVPEHYVAYDNNPTEGDNFYRVGVVYNDGTTKFSDAKKVVFTNLSSVRVFPNPVDDILSIDLKSYEGRPVGIQIYNSMGKMILVKQVDNATSAPYQITTSEMPVGSYLIRVLPQGKREMTKQIIIAR